MHKLLAVLLLPTAVLAQDVPFNAYHVPTYATNASINRYSSMVQNGILFPQKRRSQATPARNTVFIPAGRTGSGLKALAAGVPAAQRQQTEQVLVKVLGVFRKVESNLGVPPHDVASATAAFLTGNWNAYHGVEMPDRDFVPLVKQMRGILQNNAAFAKADHGARQRMYEELASVGMVMALSHLALKEKPDPAVSARLKASAKASLEGFLGTGIDKINLTSQGLALR